MKKKDFLIAAVVLLLAGILALVFRFAGGDMNGLVGLIGLVTAWAAIVLFYGLL